MVGWTGTTAALHQWRRIYVVPPLRRERRAGLQSLLASLEFKLSHTAKALLTSCLYPCMHTPHLHSVTCESS
jgi:hypothetical protein